MIRTAVFVLLLLPALSVAGELKWLRRATAIGACAASAVDAYSSFRLNPYARQGLVREANPLFSRSDGTVSARRILPVKIAQCGASLLASRWLKNDKIAIGSSMAQISAYSFVSANNFGHLSRLKTNPAVPLARPASPALVPRFDLAGSR